MFILLLPKGVIYYYKNENVYSSSLLWSYIAPGLVMASNCAVD